MVDANYKTTLSGYDLKLEGHYWNIKSTDKFNKDVGDKIDYNYGGVRASAKKDNLVLQLAQERINLADNSHSIHTAWGMYSEYTYGFLMGSGKSAAPCVTAFVACSASSIFICLRTARLL